MIKNLSRREALQFAGAAGVAGTLLMSQKLPAANGMESLSFAIVSDTHLGRKDNQAAEKNWQKTVDELNSLHCEFVLHLGDVVDGGRKEQYPVYQKIKEKLSIPIHEIPGNHDPVDLFQKHVCKEIDRAVDNGQFRFVLFNNSSRESHDGFVSEEQISWLDAQCADAVKNKLKIVVCCHVPIHSNKHPDRGWYVKPANGQTAFYNLQKKFSDTILATLHGHFHNGIRGWRDAAQTVEVLCPSVCYNQNRNLTKHIADGRATGFYVDELRAGYVIAEIGDGRLTMRYKPLGDESDKGYTAKYR